MYNVLDSSGIARVFPPTQKTKYEEENEEKFWKNESPTQKTNMRKKMNKNCGKMRATKGN